jgi:hypothetical protein
MPDGKIKKDAAAKGGLTNKEKQLILFIRELGWGDMKVRVENGQPVLIYEAVKTIRLDDKTFQRKGMPGLTVKAVP